jgi:hypothetical protein
MSPVDLLGDRVREKMADLRRLLRGGAGAVERDEAAIAATSDQLDQLLAATSEFAQLLQRDQVFDDERLNLAEQIRQIVPDLWGGCGIRYVISPPVGLQGMVYGNAAWLRRALKSLIESLGCSAPPQSDVAIGLRQLGDFVLITGNVLARRNTHPAGAIFFSPQGAVATSAAAGSDTSRSIEQLMCRRIVELHAGQLHLEHMPGSDGADAQLESFTLSLATGLPVHERSRLSCAECRHTQQAQAYAVDMELLLSRNPNATTGAQYHDKNSNR